MLEKDCPNGHRAVTYSSVASLCTDIDVVAVANCEASTIPTVEMRLVDYYSSGLSIFERPLMLEPTQPVASEECSCTKRQRAPEEGW